MLSRRLPAMLAAMLLLGAVGCGGGDEDAMDPEDAGVGSDAGFDVLLDTAATPEGGVPGVTPSGDVSQPGPPPPTGADTAGAAGADTGGMSVDTGGPSS